MLGRLHPRPTRSSCSGRAAWAWASHYSLTTRERDFTSKIARDYKELLASASGQNLNANAPTLCSGSPGLLETNEPSPQPSPTMEAKEDQKRQGQMDSSQCRGTSDVSGSVAVLGNLMERDSRGLWGLCWLVLMPACHRLASFEKREPPLRKHFCKIGLQISLWGIYCLNL